MNTPLLIARRLRLGSPREAVGVYVGVAGVALAVGVMLLSLVVIAGFKQGITRKVNAFRAQISVTGVPLQSDVSYGDLQITPPVTLTPGLKKRIVGVIPGAKVQLVAERPVMLKTDDNFVGAVLKGYDDPAKADILVENLKEGSFPHPDSLNHIVVSANTAGSLNLKVGDRLYGYFFNADHDVKMRRLTVAGIYDSRFPEFDRLYAYSPMGLPAGIDKLGEDSGTRIEINGVDEADEEPLAAALQQSLIAGVTQGDVYDYLQVDTAHRSGAFYFNWLSLLDTNVAVILVLMGVVGAVTLISSLFVLVLARVNMIGILKAQGATNGFVRHIFVILCQRIAVRGIMWGTVIALMLTALQYFTHFIPLDASTYYLDYVPVRCVWWQILLLDAGAFIISALVLILPAQYVSCLSPSKSIRFD